MILISNISFGQCSTTNLSNQGMISPGLTPQNTATLNSNKPYWQFNAVAGCEYTFTTCGNTSADTYLRLYQDGAIGSWSFQTSNDDDCSYQSTIVWTAPSNALYNILLTRYSCASLNSNAYLTYSSDCAAGGTCSDGVQNQGETGIDCGGPCPACLPTCSDGIQNQGETGIDCGGPCGPCPTCNDGIMNGDETGIDCGGMTCPACPVSCAELGFDDVASSFTGTHSAWTTLSGRNNVAGPYTIEGPIANELIVSSQFNEFHDLRPGNDPSAGFCYFPDGTIPVPNGSLNVMRLGAYQQIGMDASGMTITFTVTDPYLVYYYILGFESTGHTVNNRGFCTFEVRDDVGTVLPCGSFEVYENGPGESWTFHTTSNDVWLMDAWKSVTMDVSSYVGQDLTIEVWVADCQEGAHSGFGYFDFECLASATPDCSVAPLPVELVSFEATCSNNNATLNWTTLSEKNSSSFTILHSSDGDNFERVAKIQGAGNTTETQHYSWTSTERYSGTQYFRLIQVDYDGTSEEFNTISLEPCNEGSATAYFDANNSLHILGKDIVSATVLDATGRVVEQELERAKKDELIINIPTVSTGVFLVSVKYNDSKVEIMKVYRQ